MGLFGGGKDWNVIAILYEKKGHYQVNGNRGKGAAAEKIRDNVKKHARTIFWAVFDQKRAFIEGAVGPGKENVTPETLERIGGLADEVVCLVAPADFMAVGQFYRNFEQVEDEEVVALLKRRRITASGRAADS